MVPGAAELRAALRLQHNNAASWLPATALTVPVRYKKGVRTVVLQYSNFISVLHQYLCRTPYCTIHCGSSQQSTVLLGKLYTGLLNSRVRTGAVALRFDSSACAAILTHDERVMSSLATSS